MMRDLFALELEPIVAYPQLDQHYVHYQWPVNRIFRHFSQITPVSAASNEIIARVGDIPVAVRKSIGRGGVVYIGTPLGPILTSHDREAQQLALALANNIIRSSIGFS
jgi:hypothetical protein